MKSVKQYMRNPDFIFRKIIEEMILVPVQWNVADMDCIYTLNEIGAFIWEALSTPKSKAELENAILNEYETTKEKASEDLEHFLEELLSIGAVEEIIK